MFQLKMLVLYGECVQPMFVYTIGIETETLDEHTLLKTAVHNRNLYLEERPGSIIRLIFVSEMFKGSGAPCLPTLQHKLNEWDGLKRQSYLIFLQEGRNINQVWATYNYCCVKNSCTMYQDLAYANII